MKLIIEFDAIEEKGYIDYIKKLDKEEKQELKDIAIVAIMEHINEQFEREKREKEQWEKSIKQDTCKHDYKEIRRDSSDPEGQPYDDESGEYAWVERVSYRCTKCDKYKHELQGIEW
ncbi:hypothetical protein BCJMU51_p301 (plasmid) [Bacillus cereus]|uniref:hypothetical protein n=2 Tax=Bacillus cereus group TaxID=86661 RepID=UPI001F38BE89|nr:hypothetical protein [Bacillus cereus]BCC44674.1 hypothetical protein BCJMU01_p326 [Bacillus cereus]BCC74247.1 hypothetical protein BCJMU51_p301 [Bacillus cereus]BCD33054.1 hypothetical protein BC30102_p723 [Bacillus cereus]